MAVVAGWALLLSSGCCHAACKPDRGSVFGRCRTTPSTRAETSQHLTVITDVSRRHVPRRARRMTKTLEAINNSRVVDTWLFMTEF